MVFLHIDWIFPKQQRKTTEVQLQVHAQKQTSLKPVVSWVTLQFAFQRSFKDGFQDPALKKKPYSLRKKKKEISSEVRVVVIVVVIIIIKGYGTKQGVSCPWAQSMCSHLHKMSLKLKCKDCANAGVSK